MIEAPQRPTVTALPSLSAIDERAARRSLQDQIERLDRDLALLFARSWPRTSLSWMPASSARRTPRMLDLGELELIRDALAGRVEDARRDFAARRRFEVANRRLVEAMLRDPASHPWVRVSHEDIGEPGCRHWHVVPRYGVLGRLMNWWRVKVSSGCP